LESGAYAQRDFIPSLGSVDQYLGFTPPQASSASTAPSGYVPGPYETLANNYVSTTPRSFSSSNSWNYGNYGYADAGNIGNTPLRYSISPSKTMSGSPARYDGAPRFVDAYNENQRGMSGDYARTGYQPPSQNSFAAANYQPPSQSSFTAAGNYQPPPQNSFTAAGNTGHQYAQSSFSGAGGAPYSMSNMGNMGPPCYVGPFQFQQPYIGPLPS